MNDFRLDAGCILREDRADQEGQDCKPIIAEEYLPIPEKDQQGKEAESDREQLENEEVALS